MRDTTSSCGEYNPVPRTCFRRALAFDFFSSLESLGAEAVKEGGQEDEDEEEEEDEEEVVEEGKEGRTGTVFP